MCKQDFSAPIYLGSLQTALVIMVANTRPPRPESKLGRYYCRMIVIKLRGLVTKFLLLQKPSQRSCSWEGFERRRNPLQAYMAVSLNMCTAIGTPKYYSLVLIMRTPESTTIFGKPSYRAYWPRPSLLVLASFQV